MFSARSLLCGLLALPAILAQSSGPYVPNQEAIYYPSERTMSNNGTYFLVPMNRTAVEAAVAPYKLTALPLDDETLFPSGFPAGMHPVLVSSSLGANIQMLGLLSIPKFLINGMVYIPFVDRLGTGVPFQFPVVNLIGGDNGQLLSNTGPSLVGSTQGYLVLPGTFNPNTAAYVNGPPNSDEFSAAASYSVVDNQITGPSVGNRLYDLDFVPTANSLYTAHTFHSILNQPLILNILGFNQCLRNTQYFLENSTYTQPWFANGTVNIYSDPVPLVLQEIGALGVPPGLAGQYRGVGGYVATSQNIGFAAQSCQNAAASVDPEAAA